VKSNVTVANNVTKYLTALRVTVSPYIFSNSGFNMFDAASCTVVKFTVAETCRLTFHFWSIYFKHHMGKEKKDHILKCMFKVSAVKLSTET
jgi:hypothetical protein